PPVSAPFPTPRSSDLPPSRGGWESVWQAHVSEFYLVRAFANLLDRLAFTPARNGKVTLLRDYFRGAPDPERGWALAALTGVLGLDRKSTRLNSSHLGI